MVLSRQCRSGYDVRDDTVKALQHVTLRSLRSKLWKWTTWAVAICSTKSSTYPSFSFVMNWKASIAAVAMDVLCDTSSTNYLKPTSHALEKHNIETTDGKCLLFTAKRLVISTIIVEKLETLLRVLNFISLFLIMPRPSIRWKVLAKSVSRSHLTNGFKVLSHSGEPGCVEALLSDAKAASRGVIPHPTATRSDSRQNAHKLHASEPKIPKRQEYRMKCHWPQETNILCWQIIHSFCVEVNSVKYMSIISTDFLSIRSIGNKT